jgi:hypothetical protein
VDGGMPASYDAHRLLRRWGSCRSPRKTLDIVYVSHIDQDHIGGVLKMLDDEAEWRVHEFQKKNKNANEQSADSTPAPKVKEIWHNGFGELLKDLAKPIGDALSAMARFLLAPTFPRFAGRRSSNRISSPVSGSDQSLAGGSRQVN